VTTAGGGVGGTGISQGPITAFGSVFVNGVEFSTTGTVINTNGNPSSEGDLRVGMVVTVRGTFDANGTTGTASQIDFIDNLEGPIQSIGADNLVVMGQTVKVDSNTQYDVVTGFSDLQVGYVIEVSGPTQSDGTILATYIELKFTSCPPDEEYEIKGIVSNLGASTFQINNLTVDYSNVTPENLPSGGLRNGMFVEVKTAACYTSGDMIASKVKVQNSGLSGSAGNKMELEGFISQFNSITHDFYVNSQHVLFMDTTVYENGDSNNLADNVKVEVEGTLDANGVLIANKISFDD
jgi:hypothetical protein